ncbi:putative polyketide synthase [Amylocarpus encephaloides]|uniref:Polyketide synthase n=1 Tax=Amylocarpus encephaloides TaxID=45428 RepID=A0A9P7YDE1_9HELO|nr:putative polyketide synthase [Amylocarpus encephaloides]
MSPISAAFFCPQAGAPDEEYLNGLHSFLSQHKYGQSLLHELSDLKKSRIWSTLAAASDEVASLSPGHEYLDLLNDWAATGISGPLAATRSGVVALPLLVVLQIGQYLRYLDYHRLSHQVFLENVREAGGLQGFCGGLASAIAIASALDEAEVIQYTATAVRLMIAVGAYTEAADDTRGNGSTTLALRLKYEGQGEELTQCFPGTYVSAITEPRSISIVGPAGTLHELFIFAREQERLQVQKMDIRGKVHNPENQDLAMNLCKLCDEMPCLQLPDASELKAPIRSNRSAQKLTEGSLTKELVITILASRCEWYSILVEIAKDLKASENNAPKFLHFGLTDTISLPPFIKQGLHPVKIAAHPLIPRIAMSSVKDALDFPEDAIAIIGASCRLPGANNLEELWELLASGSDQHRPLGNDRCNLYDSFRASQSGSFTKERRFYGNFIDDVQRFDHSFFGVNPREAANMDPQQRILLEVAYEALDEAGYLAKHRREDNDNVGCFIGASFTEYLDNTKAHAPTAYTATGTIRAFLCGRLSYYFGWSGPAEVIDTACSASLVAINRACKEIQAGECHMALAGGVNIIAGINNYLDLAKAGFLSSTGQCKPFDTSADGYCRSDGAGLVVLKKLSRAVADGDGIMGIIPGIATNQGGLSASLTVPHSIAQQALYRRVLGQARIQPESVTYVEAHGPGTQAGDPLEIESLRSVFGKDMLTTSSDRILYVGSIKGNVGHSETAAGVVGLLKILTMIKHGQIPPQANHNSLNPKIAPMEPDGLSITRSLRDWSAPFRAALVNSYGAAGSNCALLCCEMSSKSKQLKRKGINMRLPLLVSAASESSLLRHSQALSAHLRKNALDLDLGDVIYTMKERRKHHKFIASIEANNIQDAADQLENFQSHSIFQHASQPPRPVVLVFSGQFDNKVKLDRGFYDELPAFRRYLDVCDKELLAQGFPSIMPTIFNTEPAEDATLLQCSIFAMQYASAQCWIDAGLNPSAVVGHSLGELTALAVSGILSLANAIRLVAARANLIDTKWGPEKGSMLVLGNCSTSDFEALSSIVQQKTGNAVEIACYNAADSIVAAGTSMAIENVEEIVRTDSRFHKIRTRRLSTTHGFHSSLTEPLLANLTKISQSLEWNEPRVPLEICSQNPLASFKHYDPSRHLREPVFFVDAIQRLEKRFESALWLEAGVDTPAAAMARSAVDQADTHAFLSLKASRTMSALDSLAGLVSTLWRNGQFVNHWQFISTSGEALAYKPVWLPPYQFERTRHWTPNKDRVIEMQQTVSTPIADLRNTVSAKRLYAPPPVLQKLLSGKPGISMKENGRFEFIINTQNERFSQIVGGHAVRSRPLCPASMYMELVVIALQLQNADGGSPRVALGGSNLVFEELNFNAALGTKVDGEVVVRLSPAGHENSLTFAVCTLPNSSSSSQNRPETVHANGVVSLGGCLPLDAWQRLTTGPMESIGKMERDDAERLMSKSTYSLFSRVVGYAPFFLGIHSLILQEREAVAIIRMPEEQPARDASSAWRFCDTVTIDSFIQVLGFIMNTSDFVAKEEVAVMVGLDQAVISPKCDFSNTGAPNRENWRVYARFELASNKQLIGDVFVYNTQDNGLVAVLSGCRFYRLPISKLERSLDQAMRLATPSLKQPEHVALSLPPPRLLPGEDLLSSSSSSDGESGSTNTLPSSVASAEQVSGGQLEGLQSLIAECTGIAHSDMTEDEILGDLGLDSLAAIELVGELSSRFSLSIASEDLIQSTLNDLSKKLGGRRSITTTALSQPAAPPADVVKVDFQTGEQPDGKRLQKLKQIFVDVVGAELEDVQPSAVLADLGIDSMSANDLKQELQDRLSIRIRDIMVDDTVEGLMKQLGILRLEGKEA